MHIFVQYYTGKRYKIDVESDYDVSDLIIAIKQILGCSCNIELRLVFNDKDLEVGNTLKYYNIRKESTVKMIIRQGGGSIPINLLKKGNQDALNQSYDPIFCECNSQRKADFENSAPITKILDNELKDDSTFIKEETCVSFRPITEPEKIPFLKELNDTRKRKDDYVKDEQEKLHSNKRRKPSLDKDNTSFITRYTGPDYLALKVQCFTLDVDAKQMRFLEELDEQIKRLPQTRLPKTVYHTCNMTAESFSWYHLGFEFMYPAFLSTTKKSDLDWRGNTLWAIELPEYSSCIADIEPYSQAPQEKEVLITCCSWFRVDEKVSNHTDRYPYYMKLSFIPPEQKQ